MSTEIIKGKRGETIRIRLPSDFHIEDRNILTDKGRATEEDCKRLGIPPYKSWPVERPKDWNL